MKRYRAAIIGLGSIGQGLDYDSEIENTEVCLTHAAAYSQHKGFDLVGGIDPSAELQNKFTLKYGVPAFPNINALKSLSPEVVSICVPSHLHKSAFDEVLKLNPKVIVCEKPISDNIEHADEMVKESVARNCLLVVNFIRRFEKGHVELKKRLDSNEFGKIHKVTVFYSKGVLNNASHFINLLSFFFGEPVNCKVLKKGRTLENLDIEPDFLLSFQNGTDAYFLAGREEEFSVKEIILLAEKGIIYYQQGGFKIECYPLEMSNVFKNYRVKSLSSQVIDTDFSRYQWYTNEAVYQYLENNVLCLSDGKSALSTQTVINQIFAQCLEMEVNS